MRVLLLLVAIVAALAAVGAHASSATVGGTGSGSASGSGTDGTSASGSGDGTATGTNGDTRTDTSAEGDVKTNVDPVAQAEAEERARLAAERAAALSNFTECHVAKPDGTVLLRGRCVATAAACLLDASTTPPTARTQFFALPVGCGGEQRGDRRCCVPSIPCRTGSGAGKIVRGVGVGGSCAGVDATVDASASAVAVTTTNAPSLPLALVQAVSAAGGINAGCCALSTRSRPTLDADAMTRIQTATDVLQQTITSRVQQFGAASGVSRIDLRVYANLQAPRIDLRNIDVKPAPDTEKSAADPNAEVVATTEIVAGDTTEAAAGQRVDIATRMRTPLFRAIRGIAAVSGRAGSLATNEVKVEEADSRAEVTTDAVMAIEAPDSTTPGRAVGPGRLRCAQRGTLAVQRHTQVTNNLVFELDDEGVAAPQNKTAGRARMQFTQGSRAIFGSVSAGVKAALIDKLDMDIESDVAFELGKLQLRRARLRCLVANCKLKASDGAKVESVDDAKAEAESEATAVELTGDAAELTNESGGDAEVAADVEATHDNARIKAVVAAKLLHLSRRVRMRAKAALQAARNAKLRVRALLADKDRPASGAPVLVGEGEIDVDTFEMDAAADSSASVEMDEQDEAGATARDDSSVANVRAAARKLLFRAKRKYRFGRRKKDAASGAVRGSVDAVEIEASANTDVELAAGDYKGKFVASARTELRANDDEPQQRPHFASGAVLEQKAGVLALASSARGNGTARISAAASVKVEVKTAHVNVSVALQARGEVETEKDLTFLRARNTADKADGADDTATWHKLWARCGASAGTPAAERPTVAARGEANKKQRVRLALAAAARIERIKKFIADRAEIAIAAGATIEADDEAELTDAEVVGEPPADMVRRRKRDVAAAEEPERTVAAARIVSRWRAGAAAEGTGNAETQDGLRTDASIKLRAQTAIELDGGVRAAAGAVLTAQAKSDDTAEQATRTAVRVSNFVGETKTSTGATASADVRAKLVASANTETTLDASAEERAAAIAASAELRERVMERVEAHVAALKVAAAARFKAALLNATAAVRMARGANVTLAARSEMRIGVRSNATATAGDGSDEAANAAARRETFVRVTGRSNVTIARGNDAGDAEVAAEARAEAVARRKARYAALRAAMRKRLTALVRANGGGFGAALEVAADGSAVRGQRHPERPFSVPRLAIAAAAESASAEDKAAGAAVDTDVYTDDANIDGKLRLAAIIEAKRGRVKAAIEAEHEGAVLIFSRADGKDSGGDAAADTRAETEVDVEFDMAAGDEVGVDVMLAGRTRATVANTLKVTKRLSVFGAEMRARGADAMAKAQAKLHARALETRDATIEVAAQLGDTRTEADDDASDDEAETSEVGNKTRFKANVAVHARARFNGTVHCEATVEAAKHADIVLLPFHTALHAKRLALKAQARVHAEIAEKDVVRASASTDAKARCPAPVVEAASLTAEKDAEFRMRISAAALAKLRENKCGVPFARMKAQADGDAVDDAKTVAASLNTNVKIKLELTAAASAMTRKRAEEEQYEFVADDEGTITARPVGEQGGTGAGQDTTTASGAPRSVAALGGAAVAALATVAMLA